MTDGLDLSAQLGALGRAGEPIDLAHMIVSLASDDAAFCASADFTSSTADPQQVLPHPRTI